MAIKRLLYLHGFNSSPASEKANQTINFFNRRSCSGDDRFEVLAPALPPEPLEAIELLSRLIQDEQPFGLIGSSLGGYYSLYLHAKYALPAVVINPAIRPYELLADFVGINQNMYTGERYEVKAEHMAQLLSLEVDEALLEKKRLFLMTESGDEVLDYKQATHKLQGAKLYLRRGGDHSYQDFSSHLPSIQYFFQGISTKG